MSSNIKPIESTTPMLHLKKLNAESACLAKGKYINQSSPLHRPACQNKTHVDLRSINHCLLHKITDVLLFPCLVSVATSNENVGTVTISLN